MVTREHTRWELPTDLLVHGKWRGGSRGERLPVIDPATEDVVAQVAAGEVDDAVAAVDAADAAAGGWAARAPRERGEILRKAFEVMVSRADDLARLLVLENGKALRDARGEVLYAAEFFRWYSEEAVRNAGMILTSPAGTNRIMTLAQPVGVSLLVTPWNFPAAMATRKIAPALAAGCTIVLKPASSTPLTALAVARILEEAGVPPGVVNVVPARRTGPFVEAVLADPRVRKLSFTGSTEVGRGLLELAGRRIVNCSMELGGNAPFIVLEDADVAAAAEGALVAKMRNGGQACTAANRFYVHASIAEEFSSSLGRAMGAMIQGSGLRPDVEVGPLIDAPSRTALAALVDEARDHGARTLTGGMVPDTPGYFYPPTVLVGVDRGAPILEHELFGPVAPIVSFDDSNDVVALANETVHGLVAYLYTGDLAKGLDTAEALEFGMVGINRGIVSDPAAPFGGVKESGIGREGGQEGMREFQETKYIALDW